MKCKFYAVVLLILAFLSLLGLREKAKTQSTVVSAPVPPQFTDKSLFLSPIKQLKSSPSIDKITGITVPHHLLATDLIAKAFDFASNQKPKQILLFSPDHFDLGTTDVSVSEVGFSTVLGDLTTDLPAVKKLEKLDFVKIQDFFYREHGLGAELPFIKYYFPSAKIIAMTFKESTPKNELDKTIDVLKKILDSNSLIIQSTDFSHYLTALNANIHDDQTIKVLEQNDPSQLFNLNQPDNIDSIASQYVQMRLQQEFFHSKLKIIGHKNSQDYTKDKLDSTTSYIVQAYLQP
jgi:AmmeMemoRadiSam system protein B